jgi:hypothetical protein
MVAVVCIAIFAILIAYPIFYSEMQIQPFIRVESFLWEYNGKGQLIRYVDPTDRVTNIGRNYTLLKLFGSTSLVKNVTVREYIANLTAVSFGLDSTTHLSNSSTQLPTETSRVTCPSANFTYIITPTAYRVNMTVYYTFTSSGTINATGIQWSTTASSNNNLFSWDNGYGNLPYASGYEFVYRGQIFVTTL